MGSSEELDETQVKVAFCRAHRMDLLSDIRLISELVKAMARCRDIDGGFVALLKTFGGEKVVDDGNLDSSDERHAR